MKLRWTKAVGFLASCGLVFSISNIPTQAAGVSSGVLTAISSYMSIANAVAKSNVATVPTSSGQTADNTTTDNTICGYSNIGIAQVDSSLNMRAAADETSDVVGKMQNNAACEILEQSGDWYKVSSGKVSGYVKGQYLVTGEAAKTIAKSILATVATVTTQTLNVRADMNTNCDIIALMPQGEQLQVLEDDGDWIKVAVDSDTGYVSKQYVTISTQLPTAQTMTELKYGGGVSDSRVSLISYATQFVGNRYVWGGTSLTKGADCSGFVLSVYAKYGISLPHSSRAQAGCGTKISASQAQPGDLFFYGSGKSISHVAIYMGNGQIVHASSPSTGIKISNAFYRSPICVVRLFKN
jgi:cell wall-associated NlpC family hydrolase